MGCCRSRTGEIAQLDNDPNFYPEHGKLVIRSGAGGRDGGKKCGCATQSCGCCEGTRDANAGSTANRPGLDALLYRVAPTA